MLTLLASISERLGEVRAAHLERPAPELAKAYRVSSLHATLSMEGNPLDHRAIADLIAGRPVTVPSGAALEVANSQRVQELLSELDPFNAADLRRAHGELMHGAAMDAGSYRTGSVNVLYGDHQAPRPAPAENLSSQVEELLDFVGSDDTPMLITSCVLHYGIVHLRPFSAGNGRMARLWQKRVLMRHWPVFGYLPVEAFILRTLPGYHAALEYADRQGDCGGFITYMMEQIDEALGELLAAQRPMMSGADRMALFLAQKARVGFSRKDYRTTFPELSTATASRDLRDATEAGVLERAGEGRVATYRARSAG